MPVREMMCCFHQEKTHKGTHETTHNDVLLSPRKDTKVHMKQHTVDIPCQCERWCSAFTRKRHIKIHMKQHTIYHDSERDGVLLSPGEDTYTHETTHSRYTMTVREMVCCFHQEKTHKDTHETTHSRYTMIVREMVCCFHQEKTHKDTHETTHSRYTMQGERWCAAFTRKRHKDKHETTHSRYTMPIREMVFCFHKEMTRKDTHEKHTGEKLCQCERCCAAFTRKKKISHEIHCNTQERNCASLRMRDMLVFLMFARSPDKTHRRKAIQMRVQLRVLHREYTDAGLSTYVSYVDLFLYIKVIKILMKEYTQE
ncbi:hypothetical protein MAR_003060 [Mya arenaria]|uniref:C2H2-type domain-containing protein n=1 Tax=Mya arenaria TaxID=6604 RepID=A0ABY7G6C4_MYAAR|nr:hypothetical protein MAR_003060 [Mya arenaria]